MNSDWIKIMSFFRRNYPSGCTAAEITTKLFYPEEKIEPKHRSETYRKLDRLVSQGFLEKPYEGFYRPKEATTKRRYYLHRRIKKYFRMDARKKQIDYTQKTEIPDLILLQLKELAAAGYNVQTTIS